MRWLAVLAALVVGFSVAHVAPARAQTDAELAVQWRAAWQVYDVTNGRVPGVVAAAREVSVEVGAPPARTFAAYSNLGNVVGKHSFATRFVTHADRQEGSTRRVDFTAIEVIPVANVPVQSAVFGKQAIRADAGYYDVTTWSLPYVITRQHVTFTDLGGGRTRVVEHLVFEAPGPLLDFTVTQGVSAHVASINAMKRAVEAGEI